MSIATFLTIAAVHCASPGSCPSGEELRQAYREEQWQIEIDMLDALYAKDPDGLFTISTARLLGFSDIYCGAPDDKKAIRCKLTARYPAYTSYEIITLSRGKEGWTILDRSAVRKDRRRRP